MQADADAAALLDGLTIDTLLMALVRGRGYETALRDPPGKRGWSGDKAISLSFAEVDEQVDRLAGILATNHAQPGASVAILAPLGREAVISLLACLRAGLSPLLLPLHADDDALIGIIDATEAVMALGVDRVGTMRPSIRLRDLAARSFTMRFVGGFGSEVPDGVAPLDSLIASAARHPVPDRPDRAVVQMIGPDGAALPMTITERDILAKALEISRALKPMASSRIVTTLVGGDLAALASGPGMALLTGVELLPLGLFDLGDLQACMAGGRKVHLVVPGAMEPAIARSRLASEPVLASLVFVQRPGDARAHPAIDRPDLAIVDLESHGADEVAVIRR